MDLLTIFHDVHTTCDKCGSAMEFSELLVSDTSRIDNRNGGRIFYVLGVLDGFESYSGEKATCPGCGGLLNWIIKISKEKDKTEIIQSVKEWLNNQ